MSRDKNYQEGLEQLALMLESENWEREEQLAEEYSRLRCLSEKRAAEVTEYN